MLELQDCAWTSRVGGVGDGAVDGRFVVCRSEGVGDARPVGLGEGVVDGVVEVLAGVSGWESGGEERGHWVEEIYRPGNDSCGLGRPCSDQVILCSRRRCAEQCCCAEKQCFEAHHVQCIRCVYGLSRDAPFWRLQRDCCDRYGQRIKYREHTVNNECHRIGKEAEVEMSKLLTLDVPSFVASVVEARLPRVSLAAPAINRIHAVT